MLTRAEALEAAGDGTFDAVIVGGGVSGAAVFRELRRRGRRVLLVDRGDFTAGTSQASGMLIWGGLLYLRNLDIKTVMVLSGARDRLLASERKDVHELRFRYMPLRNGGRSRLLVSAALYAYWILGRARRRRPYGERDFRSSELLQLSRFARSLVYEEAGLTSSDSQFALSWITGESRPDAVPINYCSLRSARWERGRSSWELDLEDRIGGGSARVRARTLINAGGIWADRINDSCGIESHYRHVFSKGVYLAFRRPPELDEALVFEMGERGDSQTFTPWGPVALWGPTETAVTRIEDGLAPSVEDVRFLLDQANRNLRLQRGPEDVVSIRCGIRPLAVKRTFGGDKYPLDFSRRHVIARDRKRAALTLYGGKFTSAPTMARKTSDLIERHLPSRSARSAPQAAASPVGRAGTHTMRFPGV